MSRITSIALGLIALREAVASPVAEVHDALITAAPELLRRDFAPNFVGYALEDNSVDLDTYTCNSQFTYTSSLGYAGCVPTTSGNQYIGQNCNANWLTLANSVSLSCDNYCVTNKIFSSTNDVAPATNVVCASKSTGIIILRTSVADTKSLGALSTPAVTSSPPSTRTSVATSISTSISQSISTSSTSTSSSPPNSRSSDAPPLVTVSPHHPVSGAVIGGAVAGIVVFVSLIALGMFFFCRKRSRDRKDKNPDSPGDQNHQPTSMPPQPGMPAMNQAYAPPATYQHMYPNQQGPGSAPPMYGPEKYANVAVMPAPVHAEYTYPDGTAEVEGFSSPVQFNQAPRKGTAELG